jgi:hypothetical protein
MPGDNHVFPKNGITIFFLKGLDTRINLHRVANIQPFRARVFARQSPAGEAFCPLTSTIGRISTHLEAPRGAWRMIGKSARRFSEESMRKTTI